MEESAKTIHDFNFIGRILDILTILQQNTDEKTAISQTEILDLMQEHEHPCSARTLTDYLKVIMKELNPEEEDGFVDKQYTISDYKIIPKGLEDKLRARDIGLSKEGSKKLQLRELKYNQLYSFEELNQIVEAILFLKNIDSSSKEKLIRKLQTLSSINYPKYSPFISETTGKISMNIGGVFEDSRVDEQAVRQNMQVIRQAIEADNGRGRKISFLFKMYNEDQQLVPKKDRNGQNRWYTVSPYHIILYNGKYYLICSMEPHDTVSFYRIDLMSDITDKTKVSSDKEIRKTESRRARHMIEGLPQEWNDRIASQFQTEHLYMYYGTPERIKLKLRNDGYTLLHDYFGNNYRFIRHVDQKWDEVSVTCVLKAMEVWAMQCSEYVEVLSPQELRESILKQSRKMVERYQKSI